MNTSVQSGRQSLRMAIGAAALVLAGCAGMSGTNSTQVTLSGAQEVPPVTTAASGFGTITVGDDKSVSGSVTTSGVVGVAAHIHDGAPGKNGPVIVPLTKSSDNTWATAPGAKFTDAQYAAYKAGDTYVNVHSAAHKGGEIRGQLKP
ncbi:MAG: CHRD domain-containing protein [Betaproteobacteria bacterium]